MNKSDGILRRICILTLWLGYISAVSGQSVKIFTVEHGLSSSMVTDVHQDRSGFIWVGSQDGLSRFDGVKFKIYRHDKRDSSGIVNDWLRTLFEDRSGSMYIGTIDGLQHYDAPTDSFHAIQFDLANGQKAGVHVHTIFQRQNGEILVGTSGNGIFKIVRTGAKLFAKRLQLGIPTDLIVKIFEDDAFNLWISTEDKGLYRIGKGYKKAYFQTKGVQNNVVTSICQDRYGRLFVGNMSSGLYRYDQSEDGFLPIPYNGRTNLPVTDLLVGKNNQLLIATDGEGIKRIDPASDKIVDMDASAASFDMSKSKLKSIFEDKAGNIWLAVYQKGLLLLADDHNRFGYIGSRSASRNSIGSSAVTALGQDKAGTVWVGTDKDGLYALPMGATKSVHYGSNGPGTTAPDNIMTVFEDSQNTLWIGSYLNGLLSLDRKTGKYTRFDKLTDANGDKVQRVHNIKEDSRKQLWIASMGSGLFCLDLMTGGLRNFNAATRKGDRADVNGLPNNWINCLLPTKDNKLLIGTFDGLACLDLQTESFVSTFGGNRLLKGSVVYSVFDDNQGNLWVGTANGLKKIVRSTREITTFDMEDGLPGNLICAIRADRAGNLWISTNRGMSKMDPANNSFLNFYAADGLQGNEFSPGVSMETQNGDLFFGGIHGITHFKPEEIHVSDKRLDVRIADLYIHDKAVKKGMKSGRYMIVDTTVSAAREFHLAYFDNSFGLEFSTLDFVNGERVSYIYSMNDNGWVKLRPGTNRLTFDNLAPGKYIFRLKAQADKSSSAVNEVTIVIHPAWYFSAWAMLGYGLLALVLFLYVFKTIRNRRRIRKEMLAHLQREEVNEAKLDFFINIAHEIRTPLTLVATPLEKLIVQDYDSERLRIYDIMSRNTKRILDLVNQLMDIRKIEKGQMSLQVSSVNMNAFIREIGGLFNEQASAKRVRFLFDLPAAAIWARIDPMNFDKVLINMLANAFKFTPEEGIVRVVLNIKTHVGKADELVLSIEDSGQFINEHETERIFECFYQSEAQRIYNRDGTGIGLYLVKQLVELHGGSIRAENMEQGCRFVTTLPIERIEPVTPAEPLFTPEPREMARASGEDEPPVRKRKRVVVVDDDSEIRNYLSGELATEYEVLTYANGEEAYKGILREKPDLVISDVMMPVMDGMALCKKLRSNPLTNHMPVVLLTARTEESMNAEGLEMGADSYLTKPFNLQILSKTVKSLIRNRQILKNNENEQQYEEEFISSITIKAADEKLLEKVHIFIDKHIADPALSVEMIANDLGISRVHLHRKLKELTNMTTRDLIRNIRLKQAEKLMNTKGLTVSEVGFAVGFTNLNSFSVAFKELYGVSPKMYGESIREV